MTGIIQPTKKFAGRGTDFFVLFILLAGTALWARKNLDFTKPPAEDAAMLLRYAGNLAADHGFVFNPGAETVDGATDFLSVVLVSQVHATGPGLESSARWAGILAHFFTIILIYFTILNICRCPRWTAVLSAAFFAVGPGLFYVETIFLTPVFAFFCLLTWTFAIRFMSGETSTVGALAFGFAALFAALTRPEGALFSGFAVMAVWIVGTSESRRIFFKPVLFSLVLPGLAYFSWHWIYFGYPLPNPFYVKGGGGVHWDSLLAAFLSLKKFLLPFLPLLASGLFARDSRKITLALMLPAAGFYLSWLLISNEMNYLLRFQYAMVPVLLVTWPLVISRLVAIMPSLKGGKEKIGTLSDFLAMGFMVLAMLFQFLTVRNFPHPHEDGRQSLGKDLSSYADLGYSIATTEAGNLALYSHWRTLDAWGLNNKEIAHAGKIPEGMLEKWAPEVIMFHFYKPGSAASEIPGWNERCEQLKSFAEKNHYVLAAIWGERKEDAHWYFVKSDFPQSDEITGIIRQREYISFFDGKSCKNFAP